MEHSDTQLCRQITSDSGISDDPSSASNHVHDLYLLLNQIGSRLFSKQATIPLQLEVSNTATVSAALAIFGMPPPTNVRSGHRESNDRRTPEDGSSEFREYRQAVHLP